MTKAAPTVKRPAEANAPCPDLLDLPTGSALPGQLLQKGLDIGDPSLHEFARREILPPSHDPIGPKRNQQFLPALSPGQVPELIAKA